MMRDLVRRAAKRLGVALQKQLYVDPVAPAGEGAVEAVMDPLAMQCRIVVLEQELLTTRLGEVRAKQALRAAACNLQLAAARLRTGADGSEGADLPASRDVSWDRVLGGATAVLRQASRTPRARARAVGLRQAYCTTPRSATPTLTAFCSIIPGVRTWGIIPSKPLT